MKKSLAQKTYLEILDEISKESDCYSGYCIFRKILECLHLNPRTLIQLKCIEKFKYESSNQEHKDIGWEGACERWEKNGYAKKFADHYHEDKSLSELYKEVTQNEKDKIN